MWYYWLHLLKLAVDVFGGDGYNSQVSLLQKNSTKICVDILFLESNFGIENIEF